MDKELLQSGPGLIEIYTVEGRRVGHAIANSNRTILLLPRESGVYVVRASFGEVMKSERVMTPGDFSKD